ncbi:MgtC/SapB family protein, partial [Vibrio splendidus]
EGIRKLAALGMMIALGHLSQSVIITLMALVILLGVDKVENSFQSLRRGVHQKWMRKGRVKK